MPHKPRNRAKSPLLCAFVPRSAGFWTCHLHDAQAVISSLGLQPESPLVQVFQPAGPSLFTIVFAVLLSVPRMYSGSNPIHRRRLTTALPSIAAVEAP